MDIAKLEKMKVVDLRNELQTRGLDTKGVKAVLIERLRAHIDGGSGEGGVIPGTPGTPGRRSRRTRSMTRSPSPSPVKVTEQLEPLEEEESNSAAVNSDAEEVESPIEDVVAEAQEDEPYTTEQVEEESNEVEEADDIEMNEEQIIENVNDDEDSEMHDNNINNRVEETILSDNMEASNEQEVDTEKPKEHEEDNTAAEIEENVTSHEIKNNISSHEVKENIPSHEIKEKKSMERDPTQSRKRSRDHSRSHSRSRSRSPKRRSEESPNASPTKGEEINLEDEPTTEDKQFGLSWYDSDLHLRIDPVTFTSAKPMTHEIYSLVWSGVRTNYGVREGKVCFEVRLAEEIAMNRSHQFRNEPHVRGFRVGFSMPHSSLILGEEENSFAYCETGRKAVNSEFTDYSKPYKLDDVIGCYLDLESTPCTIKYTLNGEDLGVAFEFDKTILGESNALFPHIVTKGYEFHVNFADNENLLANVVRPTRMRRKIRKSTLNDNAENCEVLDEEKMDEDEKLNGTNKDKQTEIESDEKTDIISTETTEANTNMEVEINKDNKNTEDFDGESNSNSVAVVSTPVNDGDNNKIEESEKSENKKAEEDKDDGPSPTKQAKVENKDKEKEKDKSNESEISEDEYEEVLPEPRDPVLLLPDYELIALIPEENYISGPQRPDSRKECEVILLVGLPGAGKTHWTLNHVKENPDKRYHVIGIDALIAKMTVDGAHRKPLHKGRWEKVYDLGINSLSSLEDIATKRRRNFILDQTNAYASVQRRKMKGFGDFKRIAVVCIPNEEELKRRTTEKSEKGNANTIRESTLNNLRANFSLPSLEFDWFDDIIYTDLNGDEAKEEVKKYNEKGKKELDANPSSRDKRNRRDHRYKRDDDRRRYNDRRHDFRNDNRRNDRYSNDRRRDFRTDNRRNDRRGGSLGGGWGGGNQQNWMQNNRSRYDDRYNNHRSGGNSGNQQNWGGQNQRNRYDDRYNHRSGGNTGGGRYESYGGGGGGSRDYRDRNNRQQRDFRPGHRDNRTEDSRGGYDRSAASSSKHTKDGYDQYSSNKSTGGKSSSQGGKWSTYGQQAAQQQTQQHANWNQSNQYQQQQPAVQQQQYYNYNNMPGYDSQQQWQNAANPNQQQDWMAWWQQQGGNPQQQQQSGVSETNQYWSQYSYPTQSTQVASTTEATKKK